MNVKVMLNSVEKVREFQNVIATYKGDFDLLSGNAVVDGRSFLGIMTLNLTQPVLLSTNVESELLTEELKEFIVS